MKQDLKIVKRTSLLILLFFSVTYLVQAQYISRLGRFRVTEVKGCAPFTVTIEDTNLITTGECTAGKPCLMTAGDGSAQQQNQFSITYLQPGTYKLSVLYQSIGADDITITVDENIEPAFEIYTCAGLKTSIKITDKNYDQYYVDFNNDGTNEVAMPSGNNQTASFTYPAAGNYTISVKGKDINSANNCNAKKQVFTALSTLPVPQINTLTTVNTSQLTLDFTPQTNIQYKTEIAVNNSTTFQQFQTLYGVNTTTISNLKTDDNFYCFRLSSFDPCANANKYSTPVCSQNFDLTIQSGVNQLAWVTSSLGVSSTEIKRNKATLTTIAGSPAFYNDTNITCKTNYCYQVINNYSGGAKSISLEKCGDSFLVVSPTPINNASSVVSNSDVTLFWKQDPSFISTGYTVFHSLNNGPLSEIGSTSDLQYIDNAYTTDPATCYQVNYIDQCDNPSIAGAMICPIRLSATRDNKNIITLKWSKLKGWNNGVKNYVVQKFDQNGSLIGTFNIGTDTVFVDDQKDLINQIVQYVVIANANEAGLVASQSNQVEVTKEANLFNPTAFTPDGVGPVENETFTVRGQFIEKMELKIFDRWGTLLFYTDNNSPWDGTNNGRPMPEGTYVWVAKITDLAGRNFSREGTVVILKKRN